MIDPKYTIPRAKVIDFIVSLGIDRDTAHNDVCEVLINPTAITVIQYERNKDGKLFTHNDELATIATLIVID